MKKLVFIFVIFAVTLCFSCNSKKDRVVAQVYHYKLYNSEILAAIPSGLSVDDSITLVNDYVESWIKEKLILHEAEKKLSPFEKQFNKELMNYRNSLLINKYYDKLCSNDSIFGNITDRERRIFEQSFDSRYTVEKEIVRVNYVKMPSNSPLHADIKDILFNESRRAAEKQTIAEVLSDTIEYLLDDDAWLYLDDLQNEVAFQIEIDDNKKPIYIDKKVGDNNILLVILDYRNQRSVNETSEERAAVEMLLMNQRKTQFLNDYIEQLYEKALKDGKIVQ